MLKENSLYTTPAERDALIKDKKKVQDALCFSLLGFLGCFKLGDSRAALKTYDQTEGKLQLQAIGDTNHDVSLSVKLAEEAGTIPNSAAQNITKLLYKIKSKQVKGKDLDDQLVRDVIKTLKISSNPPDSMVNAVVSEFESGALDLGQLASKLYNLSKLPKFKAVSGEFRSLVSKGQFTELFAKTGTPTTPTAKISHSTTPAPVAAPKVVTPPKPVRKQWGDLSDDQKLDVYKDLLQSNVTLSRTPKQLTDRGLEQADAPYMMSGLADYMANIIFEKKKYSYMSDSILATGINLYQTYRDYFNKEATTKFLRALLVGGWMMEQQSLKAGYIPMLTSKLSDFIYLLREPCERKYALPVFDEVFFKSMFTDEQFWQIYQKTDNLIDALDNLIRITWMVNGGDKPDPIQIASAAADWKFDETYAEWYVRVIAWTGAGLVEALMKRLDEIKSLEMLNKIYGKKATISPQNNMPKPKYLVPIDYKDIQPESLKTVSQISNDKKGNEYGIWFIDTANWEKNLKDKISEALAKGTVELWQNLNQIGRDAIGMTPGYMQSEPFMDWFNAQLEGSRAASIFKLTPPSPQGGKTYLNLGINFLDSKGVSAGIWLNLYNYSLTYQGVGDNFKTDLEAIYEENVQLIHKTLGDAFSTSTNVDYARGSAIAQFMLKMHKEGKFKAPDNKEFWAKIAQFSAAELGEWEVPDASQEYIFNLNTNVDTNAIRRALLKKYQHTREWYYRDRWLKQAKLGVASVVEYFIRAGYTDVVAEDQIPTDVMDFVKADLPKVNVHTTSFFDATSTGYGEWLKELVKEYIVKSLDASATVSIQSVTNALRTIHSGLNAYIDRIPSKDIIDGLKVIDTVTSRDTVVMWLEIAKDSQELKLDVLNKLFVALGLNIQNGKTTFDLDHRKSVIDCVCNMLNTMSSKGREADVDNIFDSMSYSVELKKTIVEWFSKAGVLANALRAIKGDEVSPLIEVDQARLGTLMKYNNINVPVAKDIDYKKAGFKLSDFLKTHGSWSLEPLATSKDIDDQASCDRRTAEFDAFNKYRHGQIGIKFLKSFNVDLPIQKVKNEVWDKAHEHDQVMDPVFHGTGSVAASFILRYGFAVVSSTDSSVVGRMLGDGIYFSNVLDKCGQYVSDGGYSRGIGNKGYLFQMRANLGKRGVDYQAGGGNLVSPEWCVFHPNDQLKIYKAHFIELVDKSEVQMIKKKVGKLNESVMRIEEMTEHLNQDLQNPVGKGCISYTFVDGTVPVSEFKVIDFEEWDPSIFGDRIVLEYSGLGPVLYIEVDDPSVAEIYAVRFTTEFMNSAEDFQKYLQLLRGGAPS